MGGGGTVVVVGLGPGDPGLVTAATLEAIAATDVRFLRTERHPSAHLVPGAGSFDHLYDSAETFDELYVEIVESLVVTAREAGRVLYAVPGSPGVLERSVDLLRTDGRVSVEVIPAMSFLDLAWIRLGVDPVESGVRLVDGHVFAVAAADVRSPMLVAHCHNRRVLSDIKLALDEAGDTEVVVLQRLGLEDESITTVGWADLDRVVEPDHLTSLYIPALRSSVAAELVRFEDLVRTLRSECPWDRAQTHRSLRRHLVEEACEVLDAIDGFDADSGEGVEDLEEELGDLLFQVFLHAVIAAEEGWFELADVARTIHDKLRARHPHVFGEAVSAGPNRVSWEVAKLEEKGRASVMDGIASALPSLSLADKVLKKSSVVGAPVVAEHVSELASALARMSERPDDGSVGRVLMVLAAIARQAGVDPEMALREQARDVASRVRAYERLAAESDIDVISAEADVVARLWRASRES